MRARVEAQLLRRGCESEGQEGETALMMAALAGNADIVRLNLPLARM